MGATDVPHNAQWAVEGNHFVLERKGCHTERVRFNITQIAHVSVEVGWGAMCPVKGIKVGTSRGAAIGQVTRSTGQGVLDCPRFVESGSG